MFLDPLGLLLVPGRLKVFLFVDERPLEFPLFLAELVFERAFPGGQPFFFPADLVLPEGFFAFDLLVKSRRVRAGFPLPSVAWTWLSSSWRRS